MSKWLAVAALGAMMVVVGCDKNKKDATTKESEPMKMSASASGTCAAGECSKADKAAK